MPTEELKKTESVEQTDKKNVETTDVVHVTELKDRFSSNDVNNAISSEDKKSEVKVPDKWLQNISEQEKKFREDYKQIIDEFDAIMKIDTVITSMNTSDYQKEYLEWSFRDINDYLKNSINWTEMKTIINKANLLGQLRYKLPATKNIQELKDLDKKIVDEIRFIQKLNVTTFKQIRDNMISALDDRSVTKTKEKQNEEKQRLIALEKSNDVKFKNDTDNYNKAKKGIINIIKTSDIYSFINHEEHINFFQLNSSENITNTYSLVEWNRKRDISLWISEWDSALIKSQIDKWNDFKEWRDTSMPVSYAMLKYGVRTDAEFTSLLDFWKNNSDNINFKNAIKNIPNIADKIYGTISTLLHNNDFKKMFSEKDGNFQIFKKDWWLLNPDFITLKNIFPLAMILENKKITPNMIENSTYQYIKSSVTKTSGRTATWYENYLAGKDSFSQESLASFKSKIDFWWINDNLKDSITNILRDKVGDSEKWKEQTFIGNALQDTLSWSNQEGNNRKIWLDTPSLARYFARAWFVSVGNTYFLKLNVKDNNQDKTLYVSCDLRTEKTAYSNKSIPLTWYAFDSFSKWEFSWFRVSNEPPFPMLAIIPPPDLPIEVWGDWWEPEEIPEEEKSIDPIDETLSADWLFDFSKYTLKTELATKLDNISDKIKANLLKNPNKIIYIWWHTDSLNTEQFDNQLLSEQRAQAVKNYLIGKWVNPDNIVAQWYGEAFPVVETTWDKIKEAKNRRVEITMK